MSNIAVYLCNIIMAGTGGSILARFDKKKWRSKEDLKGGDRQTRKIPRTSRLIF